MKKLGKRTKVIQLALALFLTMGLVFAFAAGTKAATPQVTGVKQMGASETRVDVSWDAVFGLRGYLYSRISTSRQMEVYQDEWLGPNKTECSFSGLNAGKTYYVQIGTASCPGKDAPADTVWSDVLEVVTVPNKVDSNSIVFKNATETSITVGWGAVEGATSYELLIYDDKEENGITVVSESTSATVTGLKKNTKYTVKIFAQKSNSSNTYIAEVPSYNYGYRSSIPTLPTKVTGVDCEYFDMSVKTGNARLVWDKNNVADGYQYEIYKYDGKKALITGSDKYADITVKNSKLKARQVYKIRVRAYVNKSNGKKEYGKWSSYEYFCRMAGADVSMKKSGTNKIKTSWKKVTGATSYTVYLGSKNSYSSNIKYKKITTTTKTSYTIKTKLKKDNYYYLRIIPNYKKGKTTYSGTVNNESSRSAYAWYSKYGKWYDYNYNN